MIDKKWKWVAKDADDATYLFQCRPTIVGTKWSDAKESSYYVDSDLWSLPFQWKDSLHEIIHHDNDKIEFRKARPELKVDDPVLVLTDTGSWLTRHFAGWSSDGDIITWEEGRTSFTSYANKGFGSREVWREYKLP